MARPRNPVPTVRRHARRNVAVCDYHCPRTGKRRQAVLGPWKSPEAAAAYRRLLADLAAARPAPGTKPVVRAQSRLCSAPTVAAVAAAYLTHAAAYYRRADGTQTSQVSCTGAVAGHLVAAAGRLPAADFGPADLKAVRDRMVARGNARPYVNAQVARVVRMFRWACEETPPLVPPETWAALKSVRPLQLMRTTAPEPGPVGPVGVRDVAATLRHLSAPAAAMVRWCWRTGCRPQDVCGLTPAQIDRAGPVWVVRPRDHKTAWRGQVREYYAGPRAQRDVAAVLAACPAGEYVFSPRRLLGRGGAKWRVASLAQAVERACVRAGVPHWHPNQIRHAAGTRFRREHGLEVAQVLLGHKSLAATQIYALPSRAAAAAAMAGG